MRTAPPVFHEEAMRDETLAPQTQAVAAADRPASGDGITLAMKGRGNSRSKKDKMGEVFSAASEVYLKQGGVL